MRRVLMFKTIAILIITMLICNSILFSEKQIYVQAPVLADFEDSGNITEWIMDRTSANIDLDVVGQDKKGAIKATEGGPSALFIPADKKKYCLGIKAAFRTMGYNFIEIRPPVFFKSNVKCVKPSLAPFLLNEFLTKRKIGNIAVYSFCSIFC